MTEARFMLDSSFCISVLAGESDQAASRLQACDEGLLVTSMIVFAEVMLGSVVRNSTGPTLAFFRSVPPQPFDLPAAQTYARLPFKRGNFDRLIAAHALSLGLTIVTSNEEDFIDVPGLRVENWTLPLT